jgi:hypothetical protein
MAGSSRHSGPSRPGRASRPFLEWAALALLAFMALNAIPAGLLLSLGPDGSRLGLPMSLLEGSPFADYRIPGLVLLPAVGGSSLAAFLLLLARHPHGHAAVASAGVIQMGWIAGQLAFIGYQGFLQPFIFVLGSATLGAACRLPGQMKRVAIRK